MLMQDYAVREAAAMLQRYYKLNSGVDLLDFLLRDIIQAEEIGSEYFAQKARAIALFGAQLNSSARQHVLSFMSAYLDEVSADISQ